MDEKDARIELLEKRLNGLEKICRNQSDMLKIIGDMAKSHSLSIGFLNKETRSIYEGLKPVFDKLFPDNPLYLDAFERIIGREVGPEDPRKLR